jgi:hypothetical protein
MLGIGLAGGLLVYLIAKLALTAVDPNTPVIIDGTDAQLYRDAGHRIMAGGPLYPAFQLAGPYTMDQRPELYPPPTMYLLVAPMSALPAPLWWLIPIVVLAATVIHHRPSPWGWVAIFLCLAWPNTGFVLLAGNPVIWAAAALGLATIWPALGPLVLLKPSLAPFALFGIWTRGWWVTTALLVAVSVAMLPMWLDYLTVLRNGQADLLYSIGHIPLMLIPLIAWLSRRRPADRTSGTRR